MPVWLEVNVPAVAVNTALLDPAAIVTVAGKLIIAVVEIMLTTAPLGPALPLRLTVHAVELAGPSEAGEHAMLLIAGAAPPTETEPPAALTETPSPAGDAPRALITPIAAVVEPADRVAETVATTPLPIPVEFIPAATQTSLPEFAEQVIDFPAAVSAGPAATERLETLVAG